MNKKYPTIPEPDYYKPIVHWEPEYPPGTLFDPKDQEWMTKPKSDVVTKDDDSDTQ